MLRSSPLLLVAACSFGAPAGIPDANAPADVPEIDAPLDAPVDPLCFGTIALTRLCLAALPESELVFTTGDDLGNASGAIATGADPLCRPLRAGSPNVCVVAGTSITIDRRVDTYGDRPIVFIATSGFIAITPLGEIDASSGRAGIVDERGPGSYVGNATCPPPTPPGIRGGGAGGSLGAMGGGGGQAEDVGGVAGATSALGESWRGGCPGQPGKASSGAAGGIGGIGGGAVGLIAAAEIIVEGRINASGGRGRANPVTDGSGGGGGGSGGLIVLDTPALRAPGRLLAEGGGGAGGSGIGGADGQDGMETDGMTPGAGGSPGGSAGGGGAGSSGGRGADGSASGSPTSAGGGGGGGGAGIIHTTDPTPPTDGVYSPAFS